MSKPAGRGFLDLSSKGERAAFAMWMREQIVAGGGRNVVSERSGVSVDQLSKYASARSVPSRATLVRLIETGILEYATPQDLAALAPWMDSKYRKAAVETKPRPEPEAPAANGEIDLLGAILVHPGITTQQRVQLTALVTLVLSGAKLDITISPRS